MSNAYCYKLKREESEIEISGACVVPRESADPPKVETLTYQAVLQNELLGRNITDVPVS